MKPERSNAIPAHMRAKIDPASNVTFIVAIIMLSSGDVAGKGSMSKVEIFS